MLKLSRTACAAAITLLIGATTDVVPGAAPRNGMCTMSVPVRCLKSSMLRCA